MLFMLTICPHAVAKAHVAAYETPEAANQRYLIASSNYSYQQICDVIREKFPQLRGSTPKGDTGAALPPVYALDTSKATKQLGMTRTPLEKTIFDTVTQLLKLEKN